MVVCILQSSATFNAVVYNQNKVESGDAQIYKMQNMGYVEYLNSPSSKDIQQYLSDYSERNPNIKKAQFHVSFSCKGDEMSHEQIWEYAQAWLKEMGYGEEGQPLVVYAHSDTDNNHLHVITSRIAPNGKKIDHKNEKRRSEQVIKKLEGRNLNYNLNKIYEDALAYKFSSLTQFSSILQSMGCKVWKDKNNEFIGIKKGNERWGRIPVGDVLAKCENEELDKDYRKRLLAQIFKYRDIASDKTHLTELLHKKLGYELKFFGSKDNPYGFLLIDHKDKRVVKGASLARIENLLQFRTAEEQFRYADNLIDRLFTENPYATTSDINKNLRRHGLKIAKGKIYAPKGEDVLLSNWVSKLKYNDKVRYVRTEYCPHSIEEAEMIGKTFNINPELLLQHQIIKYTKEERLIELYRELGKSKPKEDAYTIARNLGFSASWINDRLILLDKQNKTVETLNPNIDLHNQIISRFEKAPKENLVQTKNSFGSPDSRKKGYSRDWEIEDFDGERVSGMNISR